jgi:hypothetical protein
MKPDQPPQTSDKNKPADWPDAGKLRNLSDENPLGAWLAREECTTVFQVLRVIVLRGQATLPQVLRLNLPVLADWPVCLFIPSPQAASAA